jgi:hypothetical protein
MPQIGNIPISKRGIASLDERLSMCKWTLHSFKTHGATFQMYCLDLDIVPAKTDRTAEGYCYQKGMLQFVLNVALVATYRTQT